MKLLDRDTFREGVFVRDNHRCVICGFAAKDAHHIMERRLFPDGGYYLDNGASLCEKHHIQAETTELACEEIREKIGITNVILPPHLYRDVKYDKWGNIILVNKQRLKGELFFDESVQKILGQGNVLNLFSNYVKYPRTYHLPWSESITDDDRIHPNLDFFKEKEVVVTEKMDGENTTMYKNYIHARSLDSDSHWSQSYVRNLHGLIRHDIPEGWRICGENLYATHSIKYNNLKSFFMIFSIWNEINECLSWNQTKEWANLLEIPTVPVLYQGLYDESKIKALYQTGTEGYVIRVAEKFTYGQFRLAMGKYVRKNHVTTSHHWKFTNIEKNSLETK